MLFTTFFLLPNLKVSLLSKKYSSPAEMAAEEDVTGSTHTKKKSNS